MRRDTGLDGVYDSAERVRQREEDDDQDRRTIVITMSTYLSTLKPFSLSVLTSASKFFKVCANPLKSKNSRTRSSKCDVAKSAIVKSNDRGKRELFSVAQAFG